MTTNTNTAGTETLPGTSLRASWAHGGLQCWHPSSPCVTWAIKITRIITVNSSTRLAPGSDYRCSANAYSNGLCSNIAWPSCKHWCITSTPLASTATTLRNFAHTFQSMLVWLCHFHSSTARRVV